jgi:hypothetical protein
MGDLQETLQPELIQISVVNKYSYPVLGGPNSSCEITRDLDIQDLIRRYGIQNISTGCDILYINTYRFIIFIPQSKKAS